MASSDKQQSNIVGELNTTGSVDIITSATTKKKNQRKHKFRLTNWKILLAIFLIFLFIISDIFVDNVLSKFGTVEGRNPTGKGIIIQGIFLVLGYILATYIIDNNML